MLKEENGQVKPLPRQGQEGTPPPPLAAGLLPGDDHQPALRPLDDDGRLDYVVAGIGINVSQTAEDFGPELSRTATSLGQHMDTPPLRSEVAGQPEGRQPDPGLPLAGRPGQHGFQAGGDRGRQSVPLVLLLSGGVPPPLRHHWRNGFFEKK